MSGWFQQQIVHTGRLPLFCFFVALVLGFGFIRLSVRLVRARVRWWPGNVATVHLAAVALFALASITLLKGKIWTGLLGVFVPVVFILGAVRLARPGSPWAHWRYSGRPAKLARAERRERLVREPVIRAKIRIQDMLTGRHDQPVLTAWERQPPLGAGTVALADPGGQAGEAVDDAV